MLFQDTTTNELSLDSAYLDTLYMDSVTGQQQASWNCEIHLGGKAASFKLDTGAEVTAITEESYKELSNVSLRQATRILHGPACQPLELLGQFTTTLTHQQQSSSQVIFVIRGLKNNLLAIKALQLLSKVEAVGGEKVDVQGRFGKLFQGIGNFGEEYTIKLQDGARPHTLFTPRNVPIPLHRKVREELDRMEKLGVISKVDDPTPWCAGMVVVPKRNGEVRICVDLKPLNESVLREVHPIPKVDETLAQLAGAAVFSKLDANSGFWQIPLAKQSRPLTTFITPAGRYCFNKLLFGISSAPEVFQKRMTKILDGLDGVAGLIDASFSPTWLR